MRGRSCRTRGGSSGCKIDGPPVHTGLDFMHVTLLTLNERLTPVDHQTHRRYDFQVPSDCEELRVHVKYTPKHASREESQALSAAALRRQRADLAQRVGDALAASWTADHAAAAESAAVA